jgi:hypothetical protein
MSALRPSELRTDAVYVTPLGLLARLLPAAKRGPGSGGEAFEFAYIGNLRGKRSEPQGFWLSVRNLHILRPGAGA